MNFVLNRNKTLISTHGHGVVFKKGVPVYVPQVLWPEAQALGAIPESEIDEEERVPTKEPANPVEREDAIFAGFAQLVKSKQRESFSGTGYPHVKALASVIGFVIDAKERDGLWSRYKQKVSAQGNED